MPQDIPNDPLSYFVGYLHNQRQQQRQSEDQDLDQRISILHDMLNSPGANPARTAELLQGLMELQGAKGGRAKPKAGMKGFALGQHELPMPEILAGIIHGSVPIQGDTTQPTPKPQSPYQQGVMPEASAQLPGLKDFNGQSVMNSPVMVPPQPIQAPPEASQMLGAARQMQQYNDGPKTQPVANQPMFRSPDEMARIEGHAAGVKAGEVADAQKASTLKQLRDAGMSDAEIKQFFLRQARGASGGLQDAEGGFWQVNGHVTRATKIFDSMTGQTRLVDSMTGLSLPPDAQPAAAPSASEGTPDQQSIVAMLAAAEARKGSSLTPQEKSAALEQWQTQDANRKAVVARAGATRNTQGFTNPQVAQQVARIQQQWNNHPAVKVINTIAQQDAIMQQAVADLDNEAKRTGGYMNPASQAILVTFQKILDPLSVVRESEYARSPEGMAMFARMQGYVDRLSQGGVGMTLQDLKAFAGMASQISAIAERGTSGIRAQIERQAKLIDPNWTFKDVMGSDTGLPDYSGKAGGTNSQGSLVDFLTTP